MGERPAGSVRNMKAMFEAKAESSPPSRGRSPAGSEGFGARSDSSRPLSKVRTSFVSVDGRPPLTNRKDSKDSDSRLNESGDLAPTSDHRSRSRPNGPALGRTSSLQGVREEDVAVVSVEGSPDSKRQAELEQAKGLAGQGKGSRAHEEESHATSSRRDDKDKSATAAASAAKTPVKQVSSSQPAKPAKTPTTPKPNTQSTSVRPSPAKPSSVGKPTADTSKNTARALPTRPTPTTKTGGPTKSTATARPSATNPKAAQARKAGTASPGGFVKPPPRETTRPVKLPAGATATTTASSAKTGRSSGVGVVEHSTAKTPVGDTSVSSRTPASTQARTSDRFTRPTQSSTSKVHEKTSAPSSRRTSGTGPVRTHEQSTNSDASKTKAPATKSTISKGPKAATATPVASKSLVKPTTKPSAAPKVQGAVAAASKVTNAKAQAAKGKAKTGPIMKASQSKTSEPVAEPPLAPETQEAISPQMPAEPEIAGEVEPTVTDSIGDVPADLGAKDASISKVSLDDRNDGQAKTMEPPMINADAAAADAAKADNHDNESNVTEFAPSASLPAHSEPPTAASALPLTGQDSVPVPAMSTSATDEAASGSVEAASAPPPSAVAEALASPPPPMPSKPAPTGPEATSQAVELEMEANELAQIDSAAPATPPELKRQTPSLPSPVSSRPRIFRKASEGFRIPEAATMQRPSEEEIEAVRRESIAAGEAVNNDMVPVKIDGPEGKTEEALLVDMEETVAEQKPAAIEKLGKFEGANTHGTDLMGGPKEEPTKAKDEPDTSLVDLD